MIYDFAVIGGDMRQVYLEEINNLERNKNQIISADIMSNLQTVGELVNNDLMQEVYDNLKKRFDKIKKEDIPFVF